MAVISISHLNNGRNSRGEHTTQQYPILSFGIMCDSKTPDFFGRCFIHDFREKNKWGTGIDILIAMFFICLLFRADQHID
jgi:hypothetical protein